MLSNFFVCLFGFFLDRSNSLNEVKSMSKKVNEFIVIFNGLILVILLFIFILGEPENKKMPVFKKKMSE